MNMVDILRKFIKAERTGNWNLHLQSVYEMLPYFVSSGHPLYAKSAYVHLQMMLQLPTQNTDLHSKFDAGYHVVRCSDRYWAGLSTDRIIEQVLMRNVKTIGGGWGGGGVGGGGGGGVGGWGGGWVGVVTRGRGMTETQHHLWVLSMPACVDMNESMQKLTGASFETSDQHKDMSESRQARVVNDTIALISYLRDRDPFTLNTFSLFNIATGMTGQEGVNAEQARHIGESILISMIWQSFDDFVFCKAAQAVPLGAFVKGNGETVKVHPQLIFRRLVTVGIRTEDVQSLFAYELCSPPPALFKSSGLPLQANKAVLADTIWKALKSEQKQPSDNVQYILDGGALLHHLPWPRGSIFDSLCDQYVRYVT